MRDQKSILRHSLTFSTEQRLRSWWNLVSTLIVLFTLVATICAFASWAVRVPASMLLGLVLVRVFVIYHDYRHGSIFKGSHSAGALLNLYGLLVLNPPSIWSRSHDHHHRNVGRIFGSSIGSYPIMTKATWKRASRWQRLRYRMHRHPMTMALGYVTVFLYGMCIRSFLADRRAHYDSALAIALHATIVALLAVFAPWLMLYLILVPMTVASALGAYLFYAQHNYPGAVLMAREDWTYIDAALQSSSYLRMGPVMSWFTGNIGYHHVHHVNAKIPFYRLNEAMNGIRELQVPSSTSLSPRQIWRCLRLKLWDDERACMTA